MSNNSEKRTKGFSFTAIFLILLGLVFLLNNFGILPWEIWQNIWKFWPILLILFGVEALLGRNSSPKSLGLLLILIFIVPIILILNPLTGNPLATKSLAITKPLGNLTKASFSFHLPSSNIKINSLENSSNDLVKGSLKYSQLLPVPNFGEEKRFGEAKYNLIQADTTNIPFSSNLGNSGNFSLTRLIPIELSFKATTGVFDFDFTKLRISLVEIESEAGSTTIKFASDFSTKAFIKNKASVIKLEIPEEQAASIKIDTSIKTVNLDKKRFSKIDETFYKTANFDQATTKIEIEISGSASSIELK